MTASKGSYPLSYLSLTFFFFFFFFLLPFFFLFPLGLFPLGFLPLGLFPLGGLGLGTELGGLGLGLGVAGFDTGGVRPPHLKSDAGYLLYLQTMDRIQLYSEETRAYTPGNVL